MYMAQLLMFSFKMSAGCLFWVDSIVVKTKSNILFSQAVCTLYTTYIMY